MGQVNRGANETVPLRATLALRREAATLDNYRTGTSPYAFGSWPKAWSLDQVSQFQGYFGSLMSGNVGRRRMLKFMPSALGFAAIGLAVDFLTFRMVIDFFGTKSELSLDRLRRLWHSWQQWR